MSHLTLTDRVALEARRSFGSRSYTDFLEPVVDLPRIRLESWLSLWREVTVEEASLFWLRGVGVDIQVLMAVTNGSPVDTQMPVYLPFVDYFAPGDKNLVRLISMLKKRCPLPIPLAEPVLSPQADVEVACVRSLVQSLHVGRQAH